MYRFEVSQSHSAKYEYDFSTVSNVLLAAGTAMMPAIIIGIIMIFLVVTTIISHAGRERAERAFLILDAKVIGGKFRRTNVIWFIYYLFFYFKVPLLLRQL